jgi:CelD/BcsL family acetyltransferase involved in cellulose biosynthesis
MKSATTYPPVSERNERPASGKGSRLVRRFATREDILVSPEWVDHPIETRVYHSWPELEAIVPAWEGILNENATLSIFSTPEWLGSWWEAFGYTRRLIALAFFDKRGTLLGLVPLYEDRAAGPCFSHLTWLRFVGDGSMDSDNLDMIVRPGFERACCRAFLRWLGGHRGWDVCSLNTMPENSVGAQMLRQELAPSKWAVHRTESPGAVIPLPATWQSYVESLASTFRPLVTRYPRRLANRFAVRVRRLEDPGRLPEALDLLFSLHQKRWNVANEQGSFDLSERREFYRRIAAAFLRRGWLEFWFLELNGEAVASQFYFRYRRTVYGLQEGFDPDFASDKVGYALRAAALQHFIETGARRYDFLGGFNAHKRTWGAQPRSYQNLWLARPRSLGSCHLALDKWGTQSKEWLRGHLPSSAWHALHVVKSSVTRCAHKSSSDLCDGGKDHDAHLHTDALHNE